MEHSLQQNSVKEVWEWDEKDCWLKTARPNGCGDTVKELKCVFSQFDTKTLGQLMKGQPIPHSLTIFIFPADDSVADCPIAPVDPSSR